MQSIYHLLCSKIIDTEWFNLTLSPLCVQDSESSAHADWRGTMDAISLYCKCSSGPVIVFCV